MRGLPPEFEITEEPLPCEIDGSEALSDVWRALCRRAAAADARLRAWREEVSEAVEQEKGVRRELHLQIIEEVMDNLDRMLEDAAGQDGAPAPAVAKWIKRVDRTRRMMERVLAQDHVVPIELVSAPPGMVTVDATEPRDDVADGTIVRVLHRGWLGQGQILRKALVVVADNPAGTAGDATGPQQASTTKDTP